MRNYEKSKEQVNTAIEDVKYDIKCLDAIATEARYISKIARDTCIIKKYGDQFNLTTLRRAICGITTN
jgi:hypothetical protein